ncbi:hypothetical protein ES703_04941 [subsurface metagenome]
MWQFREKICPQCSIDLTGVEPEHIREDVPQPYSTCSNCGCALPVADIEPEPPEEPDEPSEAEPKPEPEPEAEAPETEAEPPEPSEPAA